MVLSSILSSRLLGVTKSRGTVRSPVTLHYELSEATRVTFMSEALSGRWLEKDK
jgi:hypothetical protein